MGTLEFRRVTKNVENDSFECGINSINDYVKDSYYPTIVQHAYAYSIMSKGKILGYYMILFRDIELDDFPEEIADYNPYIKEDKISAVHIRYIAIDKKYQGHKIGTSALQTIIKAVQKLALEWPIRVITLDARIELVDWYKREGFVKLKSNTPGQNGTTEAMFFDCMNFSKELSEYLESHIE